MTDIFQINSNNYLIHYGMNEYEKSEVFANVLVSLIGDEFKLPSYEEVEIKVVDDTASIAKTYKVTLL